eukprot:SM007341S21896  [mRNA]  locus=s7341:79:752:+ [translate_table: standard]
MRWRTPSARTSLGLCRSPQWGPSACSSTGARTPTWGAATTTRTSNCSSRPPRWSSRVAPTTRLRPASLSCSSPPAHNATRGRRICSTRRSPRRALCRCSAWVATATARTQLVPASTSRTRHSTSS